MFSKHQTQFCKELIERGVFTVATHYCITCDNQKRADKKMQDIEKVCLLCAIKHKSDHLQHRMVQIASVQNIQLMFKKAQLQQTGMFIQLNDYNGMGPQEQQLSMFEQMVREQLYELVIANEDQKCLELVKFVKELLLPQ